MIIVNLNDLNKENTLILNKVFLKKKKFFINNLKNFLINKNLFEVTHPVLSKLNDNFLLYKGLCYLTLCKIILKKNKNQKVYFISNNYFQFKFLKKNLKCYIRLKNQYFEKCKLFFFYSKIFIRFFTIIKFIFFELIYRSNSRVNNIKEKTHEVIFYENPLLDSMFKNNKFNNRFYSEDFTKTNVMFITNLCLKKTGKNFNILKKEKINFITYGDILNLVDFIWALYKSFRGNIKLANKYSYNINISHILKHDIFISRGNFNYFIGLLNYIFLKKISKSLKIKKIINWNENRPSDKSLILSARKFLPKTLIIGKRNFFIDYNYNFQYQISNFDFIFNLYPDQVLMVDHKAIDIASSLERRVSYVKDFDKSRFNFKKYLNSKMSDNNILVILPIIENEAKFILDRIIEIADLKKIQKKIIYIKPHPSYQKSRFIKEYKVKFLKKNINFIIDYLEPNKFKYIIGNATSGLVEYFHMKKKIIIIKNSENFIDNPISEINNNVIISYDTKDLINYFS